MAQVCIVRSYCSDNPRRTGRHCPRLDSCRVFPRTVYINSSTVSREPVRRWGLGIQAGYGMGLSNGQVKAFSYIGFGISWNFIRF